VPFCTCVNQHAHRVVDAISKFCCTPRLYPGPSRTSSEYPLFPHLKILLFSFRVYLLCVRFSVLDLHGGTVRGLSLLLPTLLRLLRSDALRQVACLFQREMFFWNAVQATILLQYSLLPTVLGSTTSFGGPTATPTPISVSPSENFGELLNNQPYMKINNY
jgi:hypothetical protein